MGFMHLKGRKISSPTSDPSGSTVHRRSGYGTADVTELDSSNSDLDRPSVSAAVVVDDITDFSTVETKPGGIIYSTTFDSSDLSVEKSSRHGAVVEVNDITEFSTAEKTPGGLDFSTNFDYPESREELAQIIQDHQYDPNYPAELLARARSLLENPSTDQNSTYAQRLATKLEVERQVQPENSIYPEVRAVVSSTDDQTLPVNTFRVWFLGTIFAILGAGFNEHFIHRFPSIWLGPYVTQLLCFPLGIAMARYLPARRFGMGRWSITLNPGPFNQKEHIIISVMSNVSFGDTDVFATKVFTVLKLDMFFGEKDLVNSTAFRLLFALSTQLMGFGTVGLARRILVSPPSMIWPETLGQIAAIKALHNDNGYLHVRGWKVSRQRFFIFAFTGMFFYFWLPDYLLQALSTFNWITWIAPQNVTLALVTGSFCGLGLNPWPTFDWNVITCFTDPILTPFWVNLNIAFGAAVICLVITPILYWNNYFNTAYFPINSVLTYNKFTTHYNVSTILNLDHTLNVTAYDSYGPVYVGIGQIVGYASIFAATPAVVCHALLYNWTEFKAGMISTFKWNSAGRSNGDIHNRLMMVYPEVPQWWFLVVLAAAFICGCIVCLCFPTGFPIWALFLAVGFGLVFQIPLGIVQATSNVYWSTQGIGELIMGYVLPGKPIVNMMFKTYTCLVPQAAVVYCQDLKMAHYMKIPARVMFAAQIYATIIACFVTVGVNWWDLNNIKDICDRHQSAHFICRGSHQFFTAAILWGVIGPERLFGSYFKALPWVFLIGFCLPIPFWLISRKYPNSFFRFASTPAMLYGVNVVFGWNFSWIWPTTVVSFIFNFYVKRRYRDWWMKYAYVLTSALSVGVALSGLVIFFAVEYPGLQVNWWGNSIPYSGVDGGGENAPQCVLKLLADGEQLPGF